MSKSLPEDVAALCSHAGIDSSRYKDFASQRIIDVPSPSGTESVMGETDANLAENGQDAPDASSAASVDGRAPLEAKVNPRATHDTPPQAVEFTQTARSTNQAEEGNSNLVELPIPSHWASGADRPPSPVTEGRRIGRSRWSAIQDAFSLDSSDHRLVSAHALPSGTISIFGVGGGVGKTTVAASLSRVLTGLGESILLAGLSSDSILPLYFGARTLPGSGLRSFLLPGQPKRGSLHVYLDSPGGQDCDDGQRVLERLCAQAEVAKGDLDRAILVFPAGSPAALMPVLRNTSASLSIIVPDLVSAIGVGKLIRFFKENEGQSVLPYFLINKFDSARALHQEMRTQLHEQLGARLLPLVIRRSDDIQDALAAGTTVIDYAPGSNVAQDFQHLADWVVSHTSRGGTGR